MAYQVKSGDTLGKIAKLHGLSLTALLALNPRYKANPNIIAVGDNIVVDHPIPEDPPSVQPAAIRPTTENEEAVTNQGDFTVARGQLTFDAEGMELPSSRFHSRVLHVPSSSSGATIGRGYDMSMRSSHEIHEDLMAAGLTEQNANQFSRLAGMQGSSAEIFIDTHNLDQLIISASQQKALFELVYAELEGDVIRICGKHDVVERYGNTDWQNLNHLIRDVLIDLRFRGDYKPVTRQKIQESVADNSLSSFASHIKNQAYWVEHINVPLDRFKRRKAYLA